jgi:hypothetical protein
MKLQDWRNVWITRNGTLDDPDPFAVTSDREVATAGSNEEGSKG